MKEFAAVIIVGLFYISLLFHLWALATDDEWRIRQSPVTGVCYEIRDQYGLMATGIAMAAIDDKYCEE